MKKVFILVLLAASVHASEYIIGDTGSNHQAPFYYLTSSTTRLTQIYIAQRVLGPCTIIDIAWMPYHQSTSGQLSAFKITLFHSTLPEVQGGFSLNYSQYYDIKEVYNHTNVAFNPVANTWLNFPFDRDYYFNGGPALVIFTTRTAAGTVGCTTKTGFEYSSGKYLILTGTESLNVRSRKRHYLRITTGYVGIEPTSLGRIKTTYK